MVRRDLFRDKVWSALALRAVADGPDALVLGCRPGAEMLAPTTWIDWLLTGDETARSQAMPEAAGRGGARPICSGCPRTPGYVNFQHPTRRTAIGFDTFDLLLDLVIAPDLSRWSWKAVKEAREEAVAMIEARVGPFAADAGWRHWRFAPKSRLPHCSPMP